MSEPSKTWLFAEVCHGKGRKDSLGASRHIWQIFPLPASPVGHWGSLGFRVRRRSGEERRELQYLLRHDGMILYLWACFTSWTAGSGLTSWARITLRKKQRRVKYFPGKAGGAAAGVWVSS